MPSSDSKAPVTDEQRARECRYELFREGRSHYCHLPREHEGEHEWFYNREQVTALLARRALEEAKWWAREMVDYDNPGAEGTAKQRIAALEQAAASKAAGGG